MLAVAQQSRATTCYAFGYLAAAYKFLLLSMSHHSPICFNMANLLFLTCHIVTLNSTLLFKPATIQSQLPTTWCSVPPIQNTSLSHKASHNMTQQAFHNMLQELMTFAQWPWKTSPPSYRRVTKLREIKKKKRPRDCTQTISVSHNTTQHIHWY